MFCESANIPLLQINGMNCYVSGACLQLPKMTVLYGVHGEIIGHTVMLTVSTKVNLKCGHCAEG